MRSQKIIVQKYGGSSVATVEKLRQVAELVTEKKQAGYDVVVVVSAMGDMTDELLEKAKEIAKEPDRRELDMLLSTGERISMSLLALAIRARGQSAVSLTGSQSGIITTASHSQARIMEVRPFRVQDELEAGHVVIVAGYQGVSYKRDITTLGRGGSDTTAVALAAALDAEACEIYSDVAGVFSADPRIVPEARLLAALSYEEMQELSEAGARVLNAQAVEFAKSRRIAIYARKTGSSRPGTVIRKHAPASPSGVRGIAHEQKVLAITAQDVALNDALTLLDELNTAGATPKQMSYASGAFSFVLSLENLYNPETISSRITGVLGKDVLRNESGAVSLIGEGITQTQIPMRRALSTLDDLSIVPTAVATSSFRVTFLLPSKRMHEATRALHRALDLAAPSAEAQIELDVLSGGGLASNPQVGDGGR